MENKPLKNWKIFAFILIALNIILIALLILGRPPHRQGGNDPGKYIVEKLKFTDQQEAAFEKLKEAHHEAVLDLRKEGDELRKSFFNGLISDSSSSNKDSLANKIAENQKQMELVTYNHFEEVKKMCNPEQKQIYNGIIQNVIKQLANPK